MGKVITVAIEKGGTAKTTTVVNLAALAAKDGMKVLVVDCDAQANCTYMLTGHKKKEEVYKGRGLFDLLRTFDEDEDDISKFIHKTNVEGVRIIPSCAKTPLCVAQLDILSKTYPYADYQFLALCLAKVSSQYDLMILDTPPTRDVMTRGAVFAADGVVVPCLCDEFSTDGLETTIQMINTINREDDMGVKLLGVVLTRVERSTATRFVREALEESDFKDELFQTMIRKASVVADSSLVASPVVVYAKNSNPARDYRALWEEIKERLEKLEG